MFPDIKINIGVTEKYLISTGITVLGTYSTGAGTMAGLVFLTFEGQKILFDNLKDKYQKANYGIYVANIESPGAYPKAIFFDASDGSTIGWYHTIVQGAPTMQYHIYSKFLQDLKSAKKVTECN